MPLGANRPWAWSIFEALIFGLTIALVFKNIKLKKLGLGSYRSLVYLWLVLIAYCALQIIPLPGYIVSMLSPSAYDWYDSANSISYYLSVDQGQSLISFIKLLSYFCLSLCVLWLANSEQRIRLLLLCLVAAGTVQALYGSFEILLGVQTSLVFQLPIDNAATGSFVYKNHYANFLVLCLAAGIGLLVTSLEKSKVTDKPGDMLRFFAHMMLSSTIIVRICIVIMVIALVMSLSRMANIAFFISMGIVGVLSLVLMKNRSRALSYLVFSVFIIDILIVSAFFGLDRLKERITETSFGQDTRDEVITDAYPILADFPLFGSGAGSFHSTFPSYRVAEVGAFYDHLHNDYLQFLIEYGLIGTFLFCSLFAFCIYKALRALSKRRNSICKGAAFGCLMAFAAMAIHIAVDFPLQAYANTVYFIVFISLAMIVNSLKLHQNSQSRVNVSTSPVKTRKRKRVKLR